MAQTGAMDTRGALGNMALIEALAIGVAINLVADYLSLLETRWLLGKLPALRHWSLQAVVLIIDLVITGAIILAVIWLVQRAGLFTADYQDPMEIALAFSVYSAPFYSTFMTSLWLWLYVLSTALLRFKSWASDARVLDVANKPTVILSILLGLFMWLGAMGAGWLLKPDENGMTRLDLAVCTIFKGRICERMMSLAKTEDRKFLLQVYACEGGRTEACVTEAVATYQVTPERAVELFRASCDGGAARGCTNLGLMYEKSRGVAVDAGQAVALYRQGCDGGHPLGCFTLGVNYFVGEGVAKDATQAGSFYQRACEGKVEGGCFLFGLALRDGIGTAVDLPAARAALTKGCDMGNADACTARDGLKP